MQPIGVFGGTFDPIHCGHLRTAYELWQELELAEVRFVPTGSPPHRPRLYASPERRLEMVRASVGGQPSFVGDDREVTRSGASSYVAPLRALRLDYQHRPALPGSGRGQADPPGDDVLCCADGACRPLRRDSRRTRLST